LGPLLTGPDPPYPPCHRSSSVFFSLWLSPFIPSSGSRHRSFPKNRLPTRFPRPLLYFLLIHFFSPKKKVKPFWSLGSSEAFDNPLPLKPSTEAWTPPRYLLLTRKPLKKRRFFPLPHRSCSTPSFQSFCEGNFPFLVLSLFTLYPFLSFPF